MIIFDLDGTLALTDHREHFLQDGRRDWDAFFEACDGDLPNEPVVEMYHRCLSSGAHVEIWTGRSDAVREKTLSWMHAHDILSPQRLRMRPAHRFTEDVTLKRLWLYERRKERLGDPIIVFEDRQRVVDMWRAEGVSCAQVAPGAF